MKKVVAWLFITLDGVVEAPNEWQFDLFDADMGASVGALSAGEDTILFGRVTYQEFASFWPTAPDDPFAGHINITTRLCRTTRFQLLLRDFAFTTI